MSLERKGNDNQEARKKEAASYTKLAESQSTHNAIPSKSVCMAMRQLRKIYFPTLTEESVFTAFDFEVAGRNIESEIKQQQEARKAVTALWDAQLEPLRKMAEDKMLPEDRRNSLKYMLALADAPANAWDRVQLFLPVSTKADEKDYQEKTHYFVLKEALVLSWLATNDTSKYPQEDKEKDLQHRLETFYNCLDRIHREQFRHPGNRNDLIVLLGGVYPGIQILSDVRGTIVAYLRDKLNLLWKAYDNRELLPEQRVALNTALFHWMRDSTVSELLVLLDPNNSFQAELEELLLKNGCNPAEVGSTLKEDAISAVSFSCPPHSPLQQIGELVASLDFRGNPDRVAALEKVQEWLENSFPTHFQIPNFFSLSANFHTMYTAHRALERNEVLLRAADLWTPLEPFLDLGRDYFKQVASSPVPLPPSQKMLEAAQEVLSKIRECESKLPVFKQEWLVSDFLSIQRKETLIEALQELAQPSFENIRDHLLVALKKKLPEMVSTWTDLAEVLKVLPESAHARFLQEHLGKATLKEIFFRNQGDTSAQTICDNMTVHILQGKFFDLSFSIPVQRSLLLALTLAMLPQARETEDAKPSSTLPPLPSPLLLHKAQEERG